MTIDPVETATVVYEVKDADGPHISSFDFSFNFDAVEAWPKFVRHRSAHQLSGIIAMIRNYHAGAIAIDAGMWRRCDLDPDLIAVGHGIDPVVWQATGGCSEGVDGLEIGWSELGTKGISRII